MPGTGTGVYCVHIHNRIAITFQATAPVIERG
jgi:hypothetical protein